MTRKIKTRKLKTRKRNKSKINKSKKYFGGANEEGDEKNTNADPTTAKTEQKPGQVSQSVTEVAKTIDDGITKTSNNLKQTTAAARQSTSDAANAADKAVTDVASAADKAASDAANAVTGVASDAANVASGLASDAANSVNKGLKNVSKSMSNVRNLLQNRKSRLQQQQAIIKQRIAERGVPNDIADLKERFEKSKSDVDLRNALQLENALKLHELFEELLENPIIADAIDNSSEGLNELLSAWMKIMGNAVTSAGESIPILGEFFVLENMFRRFLYNISDGSEAAKKIEDSFDEPIKILGLMGEDPNSESNDNQSPPPTQQDEERRRHIEELKKKIRDIDNNLDLLSDRPYINPIPQEEIEKKSQELKEKLKSVENELNELFTSQDDGSAKTEENTKPSSPADEPVKETTEIPIETTTVSSPTQDQDFTKTINNKIEENLQDPALVQGGAMGAMQHRIHTSIHDFLQSSILNAW
jgi:hypothetical protein